MNNFDNNYFIAVITGVIMMLVIHKIFKPK